jgi:energy coupling factor transporter S component ThiW
MGPWYALANAVATAFIRMTLMGVPPLALTGQVFGALLAGLLYRASKEKLIFATLGEVIGTGIIGSIASYPIMKFIMGRGELTWLFYTPSFTIAALIGSSIAYILLKTLQKTNILIKIQSELGAKSYEK